MKLIIFDMDGTLVHNDALTLQAARDGLREYFEILGETPVFPTAERIRSLVGLPATEYFAGLLPPGRRGDGARFMRITQRHEVEHLRAGRGRLFPGVGPVLGGLRRDGWRIGLVSNCLRSYLEANLEYNLDREWFEIALCLDDQPDKPANVRAAMAALGGGLGVMVGDRGSDLEAGRANRLRTVGCRYGYGGPEELATADRTVDSVDEIPAAVEALERGD